jgi:hypothetical protein
MGTLLLCWSFCGFNFQDLSSTSLFIPFVSQHSYNYGLHICWCILKIGMPVQSIISRSKICPIFTSYWLTNGSHTQKTTQIGSISQVWHAICLASFNTSKGCLREEVKLEVEGCRRTAPPKTVESSYISSMILIQTIGVVLYRSGALIT